MKIYNNKRHRRFLKSNQENKNDKKKNFKRSERKQWKQKTIRNNLSKTGVP